jgi:hypothetical protein
MAQPNQLNPTHEGRVVAAGFDARHTKGVSVTAVTLTSTTTALNVFGTTNGFVGTITGAFICASGTTAQTVTLATTAGTVGTFTTGNSVGSVTGAAAALANTALASAGTCTVTAGSASDTSVLFITYKVAES